MLVIKTLTADYFQQMFRRLEVKLFIVHDTAIVTMKIIFNDSLRSANATIAVNFIGYDLIRAVKVIG